MNPMAKEKNKVNIRVYGYKFEVHASKEKEQFS